MSDDFRDDCGDNFFGELDWQDWMIIGPLSENIAQEEQEQNRIIKEFEDTDDDWDITD
jgi:hypothetical protein